MITAFVAAFDAKAFNDRGLLKSYLASGSRIINFCRKTNRKRHGKIFDKTHGLRFVSFTSVFCYLRSGA